MNWIFLDSIEWDYDVATPMERPLGGSQSALCYLASALARRGHAVATLTATKNPRVVNGIRCLSNTAIPEDLRGQARAPSADLHEHSFSRSSRAAGHLS